MRKVYFAALVFLLISNHSVAQTYTWAGGATGDYQVAANWSPVRTAPGTTDVLSFNATTAIALTNVPNQTISSIVIATGTNAVSFATNVPTNVLTLSSAVPLVFTSAGSILAADFLTINLSNAAAFSISSGTFGISPSTGGKVIINGALTLSGGTLAFDVIGTGGTTVNGSVTYVSGVFTSVNTSALTWSSGSNYYHAFNGAGASAIPASIWVGGSTCNVTGMSSAGAVAPSGFTNTEIFFSNFKWNCAAQNGNVDLLPAGTIININDTLTMINTNNKELRLSALGKAGVNTRVYIQTGGTLTLQAASDTTTLSVMGNFSQTGGILNGVGGSGAGTAIVDLKSGVTKGASTTWQSSGSSSASQFIVQFSGTTPQTVNLASTWSAPATGRSNVVNINTDLVSGVNLTGTLKVINTASAAPATMTMAGIITGSGAVTYTGAGSGATTLIYSGTSFQTTSAIEYPSSGSPFNLTINNSLGVTFPVTFGRTVGGTLTMLNGNLALGGDTLLLSNLSLPTQLSYAGGFITTGTLGRYFPISGLPTLPGINGLFPFGSGANDRSLKLFFSSGTLSAGTAGIIYVTHTPIVGIAAISVFDNGITLDKRTQTFWNISTGAFNLGSGGETVAMTAVAANIGSVDDSSHLRLTDAVTGYGNLIATTGSNAVPTVGKTLLSQANLNTKLYIGSDGFNPLIVITFTWKGLGATSDWKDPANWTGGVGYPSASTEIAIINTTSGWQPSISTGSNINVYQLTVGSGMTLTLSPSAGLFVYDNVSYSGSASFASASTFGYASSNALQNVLDLPYGNLTLMGTGQKVLAPSVTVTGSYSITGYFPATTSGVFNYAGTGAQKVAATNYYNLNITGNHSGGVISLGPGVAPLNTITISGNFTVTATNYIGKSDFNTVDFISASSQPIPGFIYNTIHNSGNGPRVFDPMGSANVLNVISAISYVPSTYAGGPTVTGSKVKFIRSSNSVFFGGSTSVYNDLEVSGNLTGFTLDFSSQFYISGNFTISATGFNQGTSTSTFIFNGSGNQTLSATYPGFSFNNVTIAGTATRKITFEASATKAVGITGTLAVTPAFTAPNGFVTAGSTVNFSVGSSTIPVLVPATGTSNYNNVSITGGTRILSGDMIMGGNLSISGTDASNATLTVGNGVTARTLNVLGNISVTGTSSIPQITGQLDLNSSVSKLTTINLGGNLSITGKGQLAGTGSQNGTIVFNGTLPLVQVYTNTSSYLNGPANFTVGTGTTNTYVSLANSLNLLMSGTVASKSTLTVLANASLDAGTSNINTNGTGNAIFNLAAGATFVTSNTGGIEGTGTSSSNGSIINDATLARTYNDTASYTFNGATSTPFSATSAITKMANLTIGANVTLDKSILVSGILTYTSSATTFGLSNFDCTLRSTATATASVAPVPSGTSITYGTGKFNVERYYPARRAWRLVTSPLSATGSIYSAWQNNGVYATGLGTLVTGPNPTAANGLDVSPQNNFSLKIGSALTPVGDTKGANLSGSTGSADNQGYFIFVRGDRNPVNTNVANVNTTTLSSRGKLQTGTQTFTASPTAAGYTLIGNPYASPVDFAAATRNNLINRLWVWDPYLNSAQGGYILLDDFDNDGIYTSVPASPGGLTKLLQSSQAFYVQTASNGAASMVFNEANKSTVYNPSAFRPMSQTKSLRTNLYLLQPDDSTILADGNLAQFDDRFSKEVNLEDVIKFGNVNEMLGIQTGGKTVSLERRPDIIANDTLFLKLTKTTQRSYQFEFIPANMTALLTAFLEDNYTGIKTSVSLTSANTFNFTVNADPKSAASDRFKIVFKVSSGILPVTYKTIKAYQQGNNIAVEWTVEDEINISKYEVQKSTDGVSFTKVNTTAAKGTSGSITYNFLDVHPEQGNNFYRILSYNQSGAFEYSKVVLVKTGKTGTGISIYPNPVTGNTIGVALNNMAAGNYAVRLINMLGQTVMNKSLSHAAGNSMETLTPDSKLSAGIYQLEVTAPDNNISTIKVIVQ